ncbi:peptidase M4 family protein [Nocardioides sp. MAH-18]|uniref:Neutral metalloproteinase n=1 Tax=Nocardioides agri TaxID=2682843 RepID=A0A6L6XMJ9_9ACTN|nr:MULTISPECIES: M4 family metallopeptidase [unclassified Nocardioides]MBA2953300.1 M4 family metallopeptidase [Nocardioides sp. CGMCC 1.13656]MVQ48168.1 peptidase M4 family protein [Nocardioides sp. MAH-18]
MRILSGAAAAAVVALSVTGLPSAEASENDSTGFRVVDTITDADGTTHTRMVRTYGGLPVVGGDLVVHEDAAGEREGVSQTLDAPLRLVTTPAVSAAAAATHALAKAPATRDITGAKEQSSRLVVDATSGTGRLAWEVVTGGTQDDGTPSRLATYVDAATGKVLWREQQIETVDGSGQSLYSGTVPLQLTRSGSTYQLKDPTRGNTYTTDLNNGTDSLGCQLFGVNCKTGTLFTSPDTSFGNGATSSRESAGVDAQYGTNVTWDYYKSTFGRNGIFGTGAGSYNRTHYGKNYVNAFWDGTKMTYGDGDGVSYGPLVSLDVAGHEMSHGVTEHSANLTYEGESGGLNESTSDIFGTMVEFHAANSNDPGDYLIGEEFDLKNHTGLRRMDNPASDGDSVNCWSSGVGNLDVHYSSGVGNHFFYLLAEGSGAKTINGVAHNSPTCNGSTVAGIGRTAAAAIWYRALTVYMTSSTDYHGARTATLSAAQDLYGPGSAQQSAVATAWSAVGVS